MYKKDKEFIMLPTVDICFKNLMENPKVRKGFIAALMGKKPEEIEHSELLPTILSKNNKSDKLGILDVRVRLKDGTQLDLEMQVQNYAYWDERALFYLGKMFTDQIGEGEDYDRLKKCIHVSILDFIRYPDDDICYRTFHLRDDKTGKLYSDKFEIQVLELRKLPKEIETEDDIILWMKFLSGKSQEEFENMAKNNEYLGEAYNVIQELSADDVKRLEYEARQKAIRDYNSFVNGARREGHEEGIEKINKLNQCLLEDGRIEDLKKACKDEAYQKELLEEYGIQ